MSRIRTVEIIRPGPPGDLTQAVANTLYPDKTATEAAIASMPIGRQILKYPDHLPRWRATLASARYRQANILCIGDSITKGQYSNDSGSTDEATWRVRGWAPQLRSLFADRYGDPGEGIINNADVRVTPSGQQNVGSVGIGLHGMRIDSGDSITYALPACTDIWVYHWWESDSKTEPFTYTIDGGGSNTAASGSGSDLYLIEKISGLGDTAHTLILNGPATAYADISCVGAFRQTGAGVAVHRVAESGGYLDTVFPATPGTSQTRTFNLTFTHPDIDLAIVAFGTNEGGTSGQGIGHNTTDFETLLTSVTDFATSNGVDVLLLAYGSYDPAAAGSPENQSDFFAVMDTIAAANPNVAYMDIADAWGTHTEADVDNLYHDALHPSLRGHSDIAKLIYEAIGGV